MLSRTKRWSSLHVTDNDAHPFVFIFSKCKNDVAFHAINGSSICRHTHNAHLYRYDWNRYIIFDSARLTYCVTRKKEKEMRWRICCAWKAVGAERRDTCVPEEFKYEINVRLRVLSDRLYLFSFPNSPRNDECHAVKKEKENGGKEWESSYKNVKKTNFNGGNIFTEYARTEQCKISRRAKR